MRVRTLVEAIANVDFGRYDTPVQAKILLYRVCKEAFGPQPLTKLCTLMGFHDRYLKPFKNKALDDDHYQLLQKAKRYLNRSELIDTGLRVRQLQAHVACHERALISTQKQLAELYQELNTLVCSE